MRLISFCIPMVLGSLLMAQPQNVKPSGAAGPDEELQNDLNNLQQQRMQSVPAPVKAASNMILGERDPFRVPNYLEELEFLEKNNSDNVDNSVEAIKRWPLALYKVVAIIWNVNDPKAMITDRRGTMHMVKKNYQMGNKGGLVTSIKDGEITVTEKGVPIILKLIKDGSELKSEE